MPKEKTLNPAQSHHRAEKKAALAKSKKHVALQRNEKLAGRNPARLQRQIDALKSSDAPRPKDVETLAELEKQLRGVQRARNALGDAAPKFAPARPLREQQRDRRESHLGKRRRGSEERQSESDTDAEMRAIPMPRDTPPPLPRRPFADPQVQADGTRVPHALPGKPVSALPSSRTVYEAAPQMRDLRGEAVRFVPGVVAQRKKRAQGAGERLLEPEEMDRLEAAGYAGTRHVKDAEMAGRKLPGRAVEGMGVDLEEEDRRFEEEIAGLYAGEAEEVELGGGARGVHVEDVEDEDV